MLYFKNNQLDRISNIKCIHLWRDQYEHDDVFHCFLANTFRKSRPYNDTFGILNKFQKIDWADLSSDLPISVATDSCKYSLEQLFDQRTKQLFDDYDHLTILWSGGCDSSAIITSIIRNNISKDRYTILFGSGSIDEFPTFYQWMVKNKLPIRYIGDGSVYRYLQQDNSEHYINGCPEQIFQYHALALAYQKYWWTNWKDGIISHLQDQSIIFNQSQQDYLIGILEYYQKCLGIDLEYMIDLMWVIITSAMWTAADYQWASELPIESRYVFHNTSYFKTLDFARWGFTNSMRHNKLDDYTVRPEQFRWEEKKYIATVFDDWKGELKYKIKKFSQQREIKKCCNQYITIVHDDNQFIKIPHEFGNSVKYLVRKDDV